MQWGVKNAILRHARVPGGAQHLWDAPRRVLGFRGRPFQPRFVPVQVRPLLPAARLLERGDVHLLRAAATRRGAGLAGSFLNPSSSSRQRGRGAGVNSPKCCGRGGAARPNPPRHDGDDAEDQKGPREGPARRAEALQAAACRDVGEKVSREEFRGELKMFVGFPARRASLLGAAGMR